MATDATNRGLSPGYAVPGYAVPGYAVPGYAVPGYAVPGYAVAGYAVAGYAVPRPPLRYHRRNSTTSAGDGMPSLRPYAVNMRNLQ